MRKTTAISLVFLALPTFWAAGEQLPARVDNATRPYFPPIAKQRVDACSQYGAIHYTLAYELNRVRNRNAMFAENQYAPLFSWNFLNGGRNGGSEFFDGWRIAQAMGIPTAVDWKVPPASTVSSWPSGYDIYYRAMRNRAAGWRLFPMTNEAQLAEAKRWLWNADEPGRAAGGLLVCDYRVTGWQLDRIPAGGYEADKWIVKAWSPTNFGHVMVYAGYDDNVGFDFNGDGRIGNDLDITGDGQVTLADHERGAFILVNSWGADWGDHGRAYAPYRHHATTDWERGKWLAALNVHSNVQPRLTLRMTFTASDRSGLRLTAGVAAEATAQQAETKMDVPPFARASIERTGIVDGSPESDHSQFLHGGPRLGRCPLAGNSNNAPIEMGFDLSPLATQSIARAFLEFGPHKPDSLTGRVEAASLLFYSAAGIVTQQIVLVTNTTSFGREGLRLCGTAGGVPTVGTCAAERFQSLEKRQLCQAAPAEHPPIEWPGIQPDGSTLLPNMWSLKPAGRHIELGDFPVNIALHPAGRQAAVLHAGYGKHQIAIIDLKTETVVTNLPLQETWYGLAYSANGRRLYAGGAGTEELIEFALEDGLPTGEPRRIALRPAKERGIPAGIAITRDGASAYVANVWGQKISRVNLADGTSIDIALQKSGAAKPELVAPSEDEDLAAAEKRQLAALHERMMGNEPFPYACTLDEKRGRLYVSLWAQAAVEVIDLKTQTTVARWPVQEHPAEMALTRNGKRLFVGNANRNTVSVLDPETGRVTETLYAGLHPELPPGATPASLALSPDEELLFVANANVNNVAVYDIATPGRSRSLGFIPTGWYPTSVRVSHDGRKLYVANGKGLTSKANPNGPQPKPSVKGSPTVQYIGGLFRGTLGVVDLPRRKDLEAAMQEWTAMAYACSPIRPEAARTPPPGHPVPAKVGDASPIKYCVYLIRENRTYDQVLGDMKEGNGDASLCLFPEKVTPNAHALARDFVLLDNFYVESEVSADGHEWSMGAYATDFVEKTWPLSYGHNKSGKFPYPSEGNFALATPSGGYLWDKAAEAGVTYRSYGEFCHNTGGPDKPVATKAKNLRGHIDEQFRAFDMDYPDVKRAERFIAELARFEREGEMPRLQIARLGNDHTFGTSRGKPTPTAMVAESDLALGRVVEALSKSKFWPHLAIFVVEDDAQNGPDHVDAHRTVALCISPYTRGRGRDSTMYSTSSMLRTMELILGLQPMSQFDAAATPMYACFRNEPDTAAFAHKPAQVDLTEKNTVASWGWKLSEQMEFAREDAADDLLLNEVIWRSVRGPDSPMPAPVRAAYVFAKAEEEEDDD